MLQHPQKQAARETNDYRIHLWLYYIYPSDQKNNDANILKHNLESNMEQMNEWLQEKDLMIVDRGFRDATDYLESLGIN